MTSLLTTAFDGLPHSASWDRGRNGERDTRGHVWKKVGVHLVSPSRNTPVRIILYADSVRVIIRSEASCLFNSMSVSVYRIPTAYRDLFQHRPVSRKFHK